MERRQRWCLGSVWIGDGLKVLLRRGFGLLLILGCPFDVFLEEILCWICEVLKLDFGDGVKKRSFDYVIVYACRSCCLFSLFILCAMSCTFSRYFIWVKNNYFYIHSYNTCTRTKFLKFPFNYVLLSVKK